YGAGVFLENGAHGRQRFICAAGKVNRVFEETGDRTAGENGRQGTGRALEPRNRAVSGAKASAVSPKADARQ
ncbi:MAG: hypothetical protein GWN87_30045, partial [Desulfuromonadales bacterium]|nr:hypothetical protein [Desulfuromonadales bacterium]